MARKIRWMYEVSCGENSIQVLACSPIEAIEKAKETLKFTSIRQITVVRYLPGMRECIL